MLPDFTRWLVEQVDRLAPDYLIPAETKGARILEAAMEYAREVLGTPISVPLVYSTALAYMDADELARSRVLLVEDAIHTGTNLARHRRLVESYGALNIRAAVCVGHEESPMSVTPADCFRLVGPQLYREHVWQLAELVVARGLPPEVDHQLFELRAPRHLSAIWGRLESLLGPYGTLTADGPAAGAELARVGGALGTTLHFAQLPGAPAYPTKGMLRNEGVSKLRLVLDREQGCIHIVPVAFATLELQDAKPSDRLSPDDVREVVRDWTGRSDTIGERLVDEAHTLDPAAVFRMLSACAEVELVRGFARVLGAGFAADEISLTSDRRLFRKLYGAGAGDLIARDVDRRLRTALGDPVSATASKGAAKTPGTVAFDIEVADAATRAAMSLKELYDKKASQPGFDPDKRVGRSLDEIRETTPIEAPLLASRALDYGLATTTLVPYVQLDERPDGSLRVRREYRVSEATREERYTDLPTKRKAVSEEAVALIATYVSDRSQLGAEEGADEDLVACLVAILARLGLRSEEDLRLGVRPDAKAPEIVLVDTPATTAIGAVTSPSFALRDGRIVPSAGHRQASRERALALDVRGISEGIESWLDLVLSLLQEGGYDADLVRGLLLPWAMSTDQRLGLTHVLSDIERALDALEAPLALLLREERHEASPAAVHAVREHADAAARKLELLATDWASAPRAMWQDPTRRQATVLRSLAAPADASAIYDFAGALVEAVRELGGVVERIDAASARRWADGDDASRSDAPNQALEWCAALERAVTSMRATGGTSRIAPPGPVGFSDAARALLSTRDLIGALAAAMAGEYRGPPGARDAFRSGEPRGATVLDLDIAKSTLHGLRNSHGVTKDWQETGLDLAAQWGRALSGWEARDRPGDGIWMEFESPVDAAVIAGALIQEHARALRSAGVDEMHWGFRVAVDAGVMQDANGGNIIGACMDRVSRIADRASGGDDEQAVDCVYLSGDAAQHCSRDFQDGGSLAEHCATVELIDEPERPGDRVAVLRVEAKAAVGELARRVRDAAKRLEAESGVPAGDEEPLVTDDDVADAGADDAVDAA